MYTQTKSYERYFFFGLLFIVIILTGILFKPFLAVMVVGASFAVVLYPLFRWINRHITRGIKWLGALLTTSIFVLAVCVPLFFLGVVVFNQTQEAYESVILSGTYDATMNQISVSVNNILPQGFTFNAQEKLADIFSFVSQNIAKIFTTTLNTLLAVLLVILTMFYFLKDGGEWKRALVTLSPLNDADDEKIISKLILAINGIIKGYLLIAVVQGILVGLGFWVFGIGQPALFGVLAGIASLIPSVGTAFVSVPAVVYLFMTGDTGPAIGLGVWSAILVGTIDNVLNPIVIGENVHVPPLLILFSVLGGLSVMGPVGILIGPLTVSLLYVLVSIYREKGE